MTFLIISFIAGVLTILAPCILPLLPVIVGRSISDSTLSRRRVLVVVLSLGISVILFTLILKASTFFVNIPQDFWKYISGGIIFIFGLVTLFPNLWENLPFISKLNIKINTGSNKVLMQGYQKNNILGDIVVGASLGPIFSACSPTYFVILATVLPARPVVGMIYLFTYTVGLCLTLFFVSLVGQRLMASLGIVSDPHGWFKKILGIIFILVSIGILTGYDKKLQISLLDAGFFDVTKVEQKILDANQSKGNSVNGNTTATSAAGQSGQSSVDNNQAPENKTPLSPANATKFLTLAQKQAKFILAPDLSTIDGYINTDGQPITISQFKGKKVVLLDIWTYSCINCQRTIPYLNDWYKKYEDQGLVIVGLHTPEFAFERVLANVEDAVKNFNIKYPVVLDNDFSTWNAYQNQYWPRKYLIDIDGYIVYDHAGEGDYAGTEHEIQTALNERNNRLGIKTTAATGTVDPSGKIAVDPNKVSSPETYFGSTRNEYLANGNKFTVGDQTLTIPGNTEANKLYLGGTWSFSSESSSNAGGGSIIFKYQAKNVYLVASSSLGANVEVYVDGKLTNTVFIKENKLYDIVKGTDYSAHTLELKIKSPGIDAYTFTFG